jgi:hypothetical protein
LNPKPILRFIESGSRERHPDGNPHCLLEARQLKRIRVLVDGMPRGLLRDLVKNLTLKCNDMELVEGEANPDRLAEVVIRENVDAVVLALEEHELPNVCTRLLDQVPRLVVVGIVADGQRMTVTQTMQNEAGSHELLNTIRVALGVPADPNP